MNTPCTSCGSKTVPLHVSGRCGNCGPSAPATMYQHLRCTNDNNGNPRRVFVFYDAAGGIVAVEDEGYRGTPAACRGLVQLPTIETYPAERRELLRAHKTLKQLEAGK